MDRDLAAVKSEVVGASGFTPCAVTGGWLHDSIAQLKRDGTRRRKVGEVKGEHVSSVGSQ